MRTQSDTTTPRPLHHTRPRPITKGRFTAALIAITLLAAGLRLYELGSPGLWNDELYTVRSALDLANTRPDKTLGYVPTWLMLQAIGAGDLNPHDSSNWQESGLTPFMIRLPTAIVGILTIPAVMLLGRAAISPRFGIALAFMFAVCPWHIYWSQGARFYTPQMLFMSVSMLAYWAGIRHRSTRWQIVAAASFGLGVLSQPNAVILAVVPVVDLAWTLLRRKPLRIGLAGMAAWAVAGIVTASILAFGVYSGWDDYQQFLGAQKPSGIAGAFSLPLGVAFMLTPVVALAVVLGWFELYRHAPRAAVFFGVAAAAPVVGYSLWALGNNVGLRYLVVSILGLLALGAYLLMRMTFVLARRRGALYAPIPAIVVLASVSSLLASYFTTGYGFRPRWAEVYEELDRLKQPGDRIVDRHPIVASYYLRRPVDLFPPNAQAFDETNQPVIFAMETDLPVGWMLRRGELLATRDIRALRPLAEVHVLRLAPATPARSVADQTVAPEG
ncbi:MAG: glycosyltransferase family 39 protein [Phycisphaerales bacterium]